MSRRAVARFPLLLVVLLAATACSSSGDTTTTTAPSPPPATVAATTTAPPPPTTTTPPTTTPAAPAPGTFVVDTTGVRPSRIALEEGSTSVTFVNASDRDFEVGFQGGDPPGFELLAGETATVEFAGLPGGLYTFRALLGNASFPGTIDARALDGPQSLGSVTSWDGMLTARHPFGVTGWPTPGSPTASSPGPRTWGSASPTAATSPCSSRRSAGSGRWTRRACWQCSRP